jgi:hypothetical protein
VTPASGRPMSGGMILAAVRPDAGDRHTPGSRSPVRATGGRRRRRAIGGYGFGRRKIHKFKPPSE